MDNIGAIIIATIIGSIFLLILSCIPSVAFTIGIMLTIMNDIHYYTHDNNTKLESSNILLKSIFIMGCVITIEQLVSGFVNIYFGMFFFNSVKLVCMFLYNTGLLHTFYDTHIIKAINFLSGYIV